MSRLTYDWQTLLDIKHTTEELLNHVQSGTPFVLASGMAIPDFLKQDVYPKLLFKHGLLRGIWARSLNWYLMTVHFLILLDHRDEGEEDMLLLSNRSFVVGH